MTIRILNKMISSIRQICRCNLSKYLIPTLLVSLLAACSSTPPPNLQMAAAETAITHAEQKQMAGYSSPELVEARSKLTQARAAIVKKEMVNAERLAEQAELDANLASARSTAQSAKLVNEEMLKGTSVLKTEMQRNSGGSQ